MKKLSLKNFIGPFNAARQLKAELADSYWQDAFDLLVRVNYSLKYLNIHRKTMQGKIFVDIIMSIECSLKSIIISLSPKVETPEDVYLVVRKLSHNLNNLLIEAQSRAKKRLSLLNKKEVSMIQIANGLGVGTRYSVQIFFMMLNESFVDRILAQGNISSTLNEEHLHKLQKVTKKLSNIAEDAAYKYYAKDRSLIGSNLEKRDNRFLKFYNSMKTQKKI